MTCDGCDVQMEGVDHQVTIGNDGQIPAEYTLLFGSSLRQGEIVGVGTNAADDPAVAAEDGGNRGVVGRDLEPGGVDAWAANGPIYAKNTGREPVRVERAGRSVTLAPGEEMTTSCPTERKRKLALGTAAGGMAAVALRSIFG